MVSRKVHCRLLSAFAGAGLVALAAAPGWSRADTRVLQPGQTIVDAEQPGVVRGVVVDEDDRPVGGLVVVLHRPRATSSRSFPEPWVADTAGDGRALAKVQTDARGRFSFEGLAPSRYTVQPRRSGIGGGTAHLVVTREEPTAEVNLRVSLGGVVTGTVVGEDGSPLDYVTVFLTGLDLGNGLNSLGEESADRFSTKADGRFALLGLPRGIAHIQVGRRDLGWGVPAVLDMREDRVLEDVTIVLEADPSTGGSRGSGVVGIGLSPSPAGIVVREVVDGSPAARGGVRALDLVAAIDGRPTRFMTLFEFRSRCRGEVGKDVTLSLVRPDGSRKEVTLTRVVDTWSDRR